MNTLRNAIKAEAFCRQQGIACEVVPVPRQLSSECGMCLEIHPDNAVSILDLLQQSGFAVDLARL